MSVEWFAEANGWTAEEAISRYPNASTVTLRSLRNARGWTLRDLAHQIQECGVRRPTVASLSRFETGARKCPSRELLRAWAQALQVPVGDIVLPADVTDGD